MVVAALLVASFSATGWRASERLSDRLQPALEGRDIEVTGLISSLPQTSPAGTRFVFSVERARVEGAPVTLPHKVSLGWYAGAATEAEAPLPSADLRAGQRWQFTVRLRQPHGSLNPQGFDVELWLFERGIGASGYVRQTTGAAPRKLGDAQAYPVERARQSLRDAIESRVQDPQRAGVLAALVVGDQGAIERRDWDLFRTTGVAHLVSISGLHVTMIAWLAAIVVGWAWRRSIRLMHVLPAPQAARWGGLILAAAYAVLAGWGVPAQRTVWMIAAIVLLRSLGLRWPLPLVLLVVAALVVLVDPWALLSPGFWLSFVAVGLLIASQPKVAQAVRGSPWHSRFVGVLLAGLRTQAVASAGLAPLTMIFFQQVSIVGFVANLIAIPLVTLFITPIALAGILLHGLWTVAAWGVDGLLVALESMAGWPFAVWTAAAASAWVSAAGVLGGVLLVLPLPARIRLLGLPLLLPLLAPAVPRPMPGAFEVAVVDVGQGTAVLVRTQGHLLIYDSGPQYSLESDAGERVLLPLLRARGEHAVDLLMLSHRDSDHIGGAASLMARLPVREVSSSLADSHPLRASMPAHRACVAGDRWVWDGVQFKVLQPDPKQLAYPPPKANALSCVLRVEDASGKSLLLTGDIEAAQEAALVARDREALQSTVLLVPHHGSKTSSSEVFLDAVRPSIAVVQAGYRSRYGHPAAEVLQRYAVRGVALRRSDRCGAWTWNGEGLGRCEREDRRRYWHHRP